MRSVEILILEDGSITVEAVGFKGGQCDKATAAIEKALGVAKSKKRKPEYNQQVQKGQNASQ